MPLDVHIRAVRSQRLARAAAFGMHSCIYWRGLLRCRPTIDGQCEKPQNVGRQPIQIPALFRFKHQQLTSQRGDDRGRQQYQ